MDFGKLPYNTLNAVSFSLPSEPGGNNLVLGGKRAASPKIYIGCPRWSIKEWIGQLYPKGTKDAQFLDEYVKQFNCIELNPTFYNLYDAAAISKWADKAGGHEFLFCPKVYQGVSHEGSLIENVPLMHAFEKSITAFGDHLGPAFLQLNDGFGPQHKKELQYFINSIPTGLNLFVELRHPNWFSGNETDWVADLLRPVNKGWIITDTAGRRDVCHMHLTVPRAFVRFVANSLHPTDYVRIDDWIDRVAHWVDNGLEELYFIIHMHEERHSPELVSYLIDGLNEKCGLQIKKPLLVQNEGASKSSWRGTSGIQPSLFDDLL
jgi:uncharacterized protein YecE (DUF72 family)